MDDLRPIPTLALASVDEASAISLVRQGIARFALADLQPLMRAVERQREKHELNIAVFGRFKAGKSSFLNSLIGRPVLPVGAVPVTSVVTEICAASKESAEVVFRNPAESRPIPFSEIGAYISESENPGNTKDVESVRLFLPALSCFPTLRLVDTPGLDSLLAHNTEASLAWSPNVDLALVAVGVDPPLTQQDVFLIERLHEFTPNVSILLTKVDLLDEGEQREVLSFVESQLKSRFGAPIQVFPFSTKTGYGHLREQFARAYLQKASAAFLEQRGAVLTRKLITLLRSAEDYLLLALHSARSRAADRESLRVEILGTSEAVSDQRLELQLLVRHAAGRTRSVIESRLKQVALSQLRRSLDNRLSAELPAWRGGYSQLLSRFEDWLGDQLVQELSALSHAERIHFEEPLRAVQRQLQSHLQAFRDDLSGRVQHVFGVPLRTIETEIDFQPPRDPDVSVGRVFDHNWELISPLIPVLLFRWAVERRFFAKVESEVYKNLSSPTSQWEEELTAAIFRAQTGAQRRFDDLVETVGRLLSTGEADTAQEIEVYVESLRQVAKRITLPAG